MRELRVSDELKFEEYDGRLYLIMSERPWTTNRIGQRIRLAPEDSTITLNPAQVAKLRDFLNGHDRQSLAQSKSAAAQSPSDLQGEVLNQSHAI